MNRLPLQVVLAAWATLTLGLIPPAVPTARAASGALIVAGLSGTSANAEEFERLSGETRRLLGERGIPLENVQVLSGKVTRDLILQKLAAAAQSCGADDEFWLVLYGHGGRSQGGAPAFQVSGPRLTAPDLKTALDGIPARQFVFIGTSDSGAFLPVLQSPRRAALSATRADGEGNQPRFPDAWVRAFAENPKAAFAAIAARGAALVEREYVSSSLALTEHPRAGRPVHRTDSRSALRGEPARRRRQARHRPRRAAGRRDAQGVERGGHPDHDQRPCRTVGAATRHRRHAPDGRRRTRRLEPRRPRRADARTTPELHHRSGPHDRHPHLPPGVHRPRGSR